MWFRNIQLYRLPESWGMTASRLSEQLSRLTFQPCGTQDLSSVGWAKPCDNTTEPLVHQVAGQWLIALQIEQRLLPASVIKQVCEDRAEEIEAQQGFKPGRKQMKELKEAVMQELLPRAFTRRRKTFAWIDPENGWLAVDASSRNAAEPVIEALHKSMDELPLKLLNTERSPTHAMTICLELGEAPDGFTIDSDAELRALNDETSAVRYVRHSLEGDEIREHIASGKQVSKLALSFEDRVSFLLTDRFEIKRLQPLDTLTQVEEGDANTREEQFDADFVLMTGELQRLFPALLEWLGGEVTLYNKDDLVERSKSPDKLEELNTRLAGIAPDVAYEEAVKLVKESGRPSISLIQRHLRIGYNAAAGLLERMEKEGIVQSCSTGYTMKEAA